MDVETELSRLLRARDTAGPVADPVPAVHAGMRRRRRRQRLQSVAASLSVVAVAVAGAAFAQGHLHGSASQTPATRPPSEVPVSGPVAVTDVALQGDEGFAVGTTGCSKARCTVLLVTHDGGATWAQRQARGLPATCSETTCASHLRFADDRVGYAYGLGLWVTTDAGRTWATSPAVEVEALEISEDVAVRVVSDHPLCQPGCAYRVQTAPVGSLLWRTTYGPADLPGNGADLVRRGGRVVVTAHRRPVGGVVDQRTTVLRSNDGGQAFTVDDDPCSPLPFDQARESDTVDVALAADGVVVALCDPRTPQTPAGVRLSTDGGRTYGALRPLGAGAPEDVVALTPQTFVAQVYRGTALVVRRTDDGGQHWTDVTQQEIGNDDLSARQAVLHATSALDATWLLLDGSGFQRTSDGGRTWTTVVFVS